MGPRESPDHIVLPPPAPPSGAEVGVAPVPIALHSISPEEAFSRGLISLRSAGVSRFSTDHPLLDGRGVVIAILDSGIDPSIPGLQLTSDGLPKLLDLRDFSGEGRIELRTIEQRGDTLIVGSHRLVGGGRVASLADGRRVWGGLLDELRLGEAPAADINGNGTVGDSLPIVVVHSGSGWAMFIDAQGNGTFSDDRPVRDFAIARETFGWTSTNRPPPTTLAANLSDSAGVPVLDLFFDTSNHGSHVSGIAAGHDIYGVRGFDGVAPGARILGLKIANDSHGAVTVSESMVRALSYAVTFARERRMPLVVNLSFGVGNEVEGRARIDVRVDSVLAANPDVVMMVAAGNDGPGLSTVGFPGSALRVFSIGASEPAVFSGAPAGSSIDEPVAPYSSRGGEIGAPDIVAPGTAYSTVPNFSIGGEQESGTSMATPYASGLAARLLSGTTRPHASAIYQALRQSARRNSSVGVLDAGAGMPDLEAAHEWLSAHPTVPEVGVEVGTLLGRGAIYRTVSVTERSLPIRFTLVRRDSKEPILLTLIGSAPWIHLPSSVTLTNGRIEVTGMLDLTGATAASWRTGSIEVHTADSTVGALAIIPVTVRIPLADDGRVAAATVMLPPGGVGRVVFRADSGRGFQVEVATPPAAGQVTASLHEPGGMPFRDGATLPAGSGDGAALFDLGAGDVESGYYEMAVLSGPLAPSKATVTVRRAPVELEAFALPESVSISARSLVVAPLSLRLRLGLVGAEQHRAIRGSGSAPIRVSIPVPTWATRLQVDSRMPREQWDRFTDFGVTFLDREGRQITSSPLDYHIGRAAPELPSRLAGDSLIILLDPAFAGPDQEEWRFDLTVRFYTERVVALDDGERPAQSVAPGKVLEQRFRMGALPIALPEGFAPVVVVLAQEGDDYIWTRELALPGGNRP